MGEGWGEGIYWLLITINNKFLGIKMIKLISYITVICMIFLMQSQAQADEPLRIYTVNYPLQYFAQRIAGKHAEVIMPAPAGVDPAFWQPDIETILEYQRADLVLLNGAGYARWVKNVSLPPSRLVSTSAGFSDAFIEIEATTTHSHGPGGEHSHAGTAFTTWLDFTQAVGQARAIKNALVKRRPDQADVFEQNFNLLAQELRELDTDLRLLLEKVDVPLLASHPVYQYLARAYRLDLHSVTWEPDEVPSAGEWVALQALLKEHPARVMLWEDGPNQETVVRLQTFGIDVVVFSPAGNRPEAGDFMSVMRENLQRLEAAISAP